jgi:hypothetical protein
MAPRLMLENATGRAWDDLGDSELEIVELGGRSRRRRPFAGPALGQAGDVFGFLFNILSEGVGLLAKIVAVPMDLVGQAASTVIDGLAAAVGQIPLVGEVLAQVLIVAKVIINAALKIPETLLKAVSNIFGAFAKLSSGQQTSLSKTAMGKLMALATSRGLEKQARTALSQNAPVVQGQTIQPPAQTMDEQPGYLKVLAGIGFPAALAGGVALLGRA